MKKLLASIVLSVFFIGGALAIEGVLWGWNPYGTLNPLILGYNTDGMTPEHKLLCLDAISRWSVEGYGVDIRPYICIPDTPISLVFLEQHMGGSIPLAQSDFPWFGNSAYIRINADADWQTYDLLSVLVHEVGHGIGLLHVTEPDSIMQYSYTGFYFPSLNDWNRARTLYAPRIASPRRR